MVFLTFLVDKFILVLNIERICKECDEECEKGLMLSSEW